MCISLEPVSATHKHVHSKVDILDSEASRSVSSPPR